jgi:hypothetical protein
MGGVIGRVLFSIAKVSVVVEPTARLTGATIFGIGEIE